MYGWAVPWPREAATFRATSLPCRPALLGVGGQGGELELADDVVAQVQGLREGAEPVRIPGYRNGQAPFGIWTPARMLVAPQWINSSHPDLDVGFVVLNPHDGQNIQQVLGANRLGIDSGYLGDAVHELYQQAVADESSSAG